MELLIDTLLVMAGAIICVGALGALGVMSLALIASGMLMGATIAFLMIWLLNIPYPLSLYLFYLYSATGGLYIFLKLVVAVWRQKDK